MLSDKNHPLIISASFWKIIPFHRLHFNIVDRISPILYIHIQSNAFCIQRHIDCLLLFQIVDTIYFNA